MAQVSHQMQQTWKIWHSNVPFDEIFAASMCIHLTSLKNPVRNSSPNERFHKHAIMALEHAHFSMWMFGHFLASAWTLHFSWLHLSVQQLNCCMWFQLGICKSNKSAKPGYDQNQLKIIKWCHHAQEESDHLQWWLFFCWKKTNAEWQWSKQPWCFH